MNRAATASLGLLGGVLLGACSGGGDTPAPDAGYNCELETRDDDFVAGIEKVSEGGVAGREQVRQHGGAGSRRRHPVYETRELGDQLHQIRRAIVDL